MYSDTPCGRTNIHHSGIEYYLNFLLKIQKEKLAIIVVASSNMPASCSARFLEERSHLSATCHEYAYDDDTIQRVSNSFIVTFRFVQGHNERLFFPFPKAQRRRKYLESEFFMLSDSKHVTRKERDQAINKVRITVDDVKKKHMDSHNKELM